MTLPRPIRVLAIALVLLGWTAVPARAADPVELGVSLVNLTVHFEKNEDTLTSLGVGSTLSGFLGLSPGVFASFFLGSRLAVEPQFGLIWFSAGNESFHVLNFTAQVDYFFRPISQRSVYVFGAAGVLDASDADTTPKTAGLGIGYRVPVGDSLTVRIDGRFTRFMVKGEGDSDAVIVTVSLGGLFR